MNKHGLWQSTHDTFGKLIWHFLLHYTYVYAIQRPYHTFSICFLSLNSSNSFIVQYEVFQKGMSKIGLFNFCLGKFQK